MKKILFLIVTVVCMTSTCIAEGLTPIYENTFDNGIADWSSNSVDYGSAAVTSDEGNNVLDIAALTSSGFPGGYAVDKRAIKSLDCGGNYTLTMKGKIIGNYEYVGLIFRKGEKSSEYNALILDKYTKTFCISNNTLYTQTNFITGTKANYSLISEFDPTVWNEYTFSILENNIKVYVNGTLIIDYTDDNSSIHSGAAVGGGVLTSQKSDSHLYIDDIYVETSDSFISGIYEIRGTSEKDLKASPSGVKVLPEGFRVDFIENVNSVELTVTDGETEIPVSEITVSDNSASFKTKKRFTEGKEYTINLKKAVTASGSTYEGFSAIPFTAAHGVLTTEAEHNSATGLTVTVTTSNRREASSAYIIAVLYKDGAVVEIKSAEATRLRDKTPSTLPAITFTKTGDKIAVFTWNDMLGTVMYSKPLEIEVTR